MIEERRIIDATTCELMENCIWIIIPQHSLKRKKETPDSIFSAA